MAYAKFHRIRPKLIVILVVFVLLVGGGVTALILLTRPDEAAAAGRYHQINPVPTSCHALTNPTFSFTIIGAFPPRDGTTAEQCVGEGHDSDGGPVASVTWEVFPDPGGVRAAQNRAARSDGTPLSGTGFENDPYVGYAADTGQGDNCTVEFRRSNEWVEIDFSYLPKVTDLASCRKLVIPYAKPLYTSVG